MQSPHSEPADEFGRPNLDRGAEPAADAAPGGDVYDWYHRGLDLLDRGNAAAAAQLLEHAAAAEPESRSVREALARAQYSSGKFAAARRSFEQIVDANPVEDYARFGLGLASEKTGDYRSAVEHLSLAVAMRPENQHYGDALARARTARAARDSR